MGFAALTGLVALLANARGRTPVTPPAHLGLGRRTVNPSFVFPNCPLPGSQERVCLGSPGSRELGAQSGAHAGPSLCPAVESPALGGGETEGGTRAARWAPVLRTEACLQVPGSAGPLVRRPGGWAQKGRPRHLSVNVAQPV